ncbi:carbohydrate ABC transporter permease [Mycoplasma phocoenae]|uniref:Carbohydrate ABC transporter permease n=1 Tax=Mycoplasma phocoenae TaxID=754517 RepID=A0A858U4F8_9MOLU|nr:carbohydrate ABC transporter permease [Mycoplasma phocoenae]QJG66921.1 carbohydrate ABC transporter permease [Mycoplasma phocoenae]
MYRIKLLVKQKFLKHSLNSKQSLMTKQVDTKSVWSSLLGFMFKMLVLVFFGLIIIFPFYYMIMTSLISNDLSLKEGELILYPSKVNGKGWEFHFENFKKALEEGYLQAVLFTAAVTSLSVVCKIFFSITFGYAFSLRKWKYKNLSWALFLSLLVLPEAALLAGQYKVVVTLGWHVGFYRLLSLTLPFVASVFSGYMFRTAFEAVPDSVKESAMIDGASELKFFITIAIPMVKGTIWTVGILTALAAWNSFLWPSLIIGPGDNSYPVMNVWLFTTGKDNSSSEISRVFRNIRMAAAILAIAPMFITYFLFRGRIMRTISRNNVASKG